MKRLFTSLVALATIALSANAQSEYMMKVAKANGSVVSINTEDVNQVTFQAPDAVDKVKEHVRTQLLGIAQKLDLSAITLAAHSIQQFNDEVLLSGKYDQQMMLIALGVIAKVAPLLQPQDAPEALAAQGIAKVIPIDLSVLDGTLTVNETMTFEPGTEGFIIAYTKEQGGQQITNTVTFKGASADKYQLIVPVPKALISETIPEGTVFVIAVPKQYDFTVQTTAFGAAATIISAKFALDIQSGSPYITSLKNAFASTGEVEFNFPSLTGQPNPTKKMMFGTSLDPTKNSATSNFQFLIGDQPAATFNFSGNLNPEHQIDFSKFNIVTFDLHEFLNTMFTNSAASAEVTLMGDLGLSINVLDGLAAAKYTFNSNTARHAKDKATLEDLAAKLNEVVNGKFTCKGAGIVDAPIKFQTTQFGIDLVNMPAIDLEGNGTYVPITSLYDMESLVYAVNIERHAMEPMADGVKIARQLIKFAQKVIGMVQSLQNTEQSAEQ